MRLLARHYCRLFYFLLILMGLPFSFLGAKTVLYETNSKNTSTNPYNIIVLEEKDEFTSGSEIKAIIFHDKFEIPAGFEIQSTKAISGTATYANRILTVIGSDIYQPIAIQKTDGSTLNMTIDRTNRATDIIYSGCSKDFPQALPATEEKLPFSIGIACQVGVDKRKSLVLSVPDSATISSSSLFDRLGKGERWRLYELVDSKSDDGIIGNFIITYNQKDYKINLVLLDNELILLRKTVEKLRLELSQLNKTHQDLLNKNKKLQTQDNMIAMMMQIFDVYFGIGMSSLKLNVANSELGPLDINDSGLTIQLSSVSEPIFDHFILQTGFSSTLPTSQKVDRLDAFQIDGSLGYLFSFSNFQVIPFISGAYRNFSHQTSTMNFQVGQIGGGLEGIYSMTENDRVGLKIDSQPLGSTILKTHTHFGLNYEHQFDSPKVWRLGTRINSQTIGLVNESGDPRTMQDTQMMLYISL